jgi:hypothetical protein
MEAAACSPVAVTYDLLRHRAMRECGSGETMKIIRIVLLIANGVYLVLSVVGVVAFLRAADVLSLLSAIPLVVFIFLLAGNSPTSCGVRRAQNTPPIAS